MDHPVVSPQQQLSTARARKRPAVVLSLPFATDYCQPIITPQEDRPSWKQRLLQVSNIASMLCVVDCTVLPLITILLTVLGMAEQPEKMQWLHSFGHHMAVYFVLPVGSMTTTINFVTHKKFSLTAPAVLGLLLIYIANCVMAPCNHEDAASGHAHHHEDHDMSSSHHEHMMSHHDAHDSMPSDSVVSWMMSWESGQAHRFTNVLGCALLLTSNYRAQRLHNCQDCQKQCNVRK